MRMFLLSLIMVREARFMCECRKNVLKYKNKSIKNKGNKGKRK